MKFKLFCVLLAVGGGVIGDVDALLGESKAEWVLQNKTTKLVCMLASFELDIDVSWYNEHANGLETSFFKFNSTTSVLLPNSTCQSNASSIEFILQNSKDTRFTGHNGFIVSITMSKSDQKYEMSRFALSGDFGDRKMFTGLNASLAGYREDSKNTSFWNTPVGNRYKCDNPSPPLTLFRSEPCKSNVHLPQLQIVAIMLNADIQAFQDDFDWSDDITFCEGDGLPFPVIPIAVGCSLGGLILIVLAAFVLGRKRWTTVDSKIVRMK